MTKISFSDTVGNMIPGRIHIPNRPKKGTAVIFPGYGYSAEAPLLYFLRMLFLEKGIQVINIDWQYSSDPQFQQLDYGDQEKRIQQDTAEIIQQVGRDKEILPLYWVGKSIGATGILKALEKQSKMMGDRLIFLTPGFDLRGAQLPEDFWGKALLLIGSADPFFMKPLWETIDSRIQKHLVPGADHQWNLQNDSMASIGALKVALERVQEFV